MKMLTILILVLLLTGCPGMGNRASIQRGVFTHRDVVCFSVNKKDVLDFYVIYYWPKKKYTVVKADSSFGLSYPNTCFTVKFKHGYQYMFRYGLNGKSYSHSIFVDNDGNY